jgi:TPR repeat protein
MRGCTENLAALYFKGEGVEQDTVRAANLCRAAAASGDWLSQDMLSWMLLEGETVPFNACEARCWALPAAERHRVSDDTPRYGFALKGVFGMQKGRSKKGVALSIDTQHNRLVELLRKKGRKDRLQSVWDISSIKAET